MKNENENNAPATCREVIEVLSDYIEGDLSPEDAEALERHMADCPPCERFLRNLETSIDWTRRMNDADVPREVMDRLRGFLKTKVGKSRG